jgi:hypothetical protein
MDLSVSTGEAVQAIVESVVNAPADIRARAKAILEGK